MKSLLSVIIVCGMIGVLFMIQGCSVQAVNMNRQAQVYMKHGYYEKAKDLLLKSFKNDYENPASHYWLAQCYEKLGEIDNALWEYGIAIRFDPGYEVAQMAYIKALYRNNRVDESIEATALFLKNKKESARYFMKLARDFLDEGMEPHAVLAYEAAAKAEPRNPHPYLELADYYLQKQDKNKEIEYLSRAFKADPYYPGLARRLGKLGMKVDVPQPAPRWRPPSELEKELSEVGGK